METIAGRKEKGKIKGLISHMWLILLYTVQPVIPTSMFVPNFKILCQVDPEKSLTKIFIYTLPWSERLKKEKIEKEGKINLSTLVLFSVMHLVVYMLYTKFKNSDSNRS